MSLDPTGITTIIGNGLRFLGELFGFINKKTELNNTPEMQERDKAKKDQEQKDKIEKTIQEGDDQDISNATS